MKIVYCINRIDFTGGIEIVTITKANALAEQPDVQVWIVVADNLGEPAIPVSNKVKVINLKIGYVDQPEQTSAFSYIRWEMAKERKHKRELCKVLNEIYPDVIISTSKSERFFLANIKIKSNPVRVREYHHTKDRRRLAFGDSLRGKFQTVLGDFYEFKIANKGYDCIVSLTNEDYENNWHHDPKVRVMPNPLTNKSDTTSTLDAKKVINVGRLAAEKNQASLIRAWKEVNGLHPDWKLQIYGDGPLRDTLRSLINQEGLQGCITLEGNTTEVPKKLSQSSIFALSSVIEGFVLVLMEAMSAGLPCISYSCPCSPKDIISEGIDGFLVPVGDEHLLAQRICTLIEDEGLRRRMSANALIKAKKYDIGNIIPLWMDLFHELLSKKRQHK